MNAYKNILGKLLLSKIDNIANYDEKKKYLINCIDNSNKQIDFNIFNNNTSINLPINVNSVEFCKLCNSNEFISNKHEESCTKCGYIRPFQQNLKIFEKTVAFIKPKENNIKINIDGKIVTRDLNKINLWLQEKDPLYESTLKITEAIDNIYALKGTELNKQVKNTIIAIWYNIFNYLQLYKTSKTKAFMALSIYYGSIIHNINITLQSIITYYNLSLSNDIIPTNNIIVSIFKDTEYEKYLKINLVKSKICNIQLSRVNEQKVKNIINHLKLKMPSFTLTNTEYSGIIYFICKDSIIDRMTLSDIEKKCNVGTSTIRKYSKQINNFYKKYPDLKKQI